MTEYRDCYQWCEKKQISEEFRKPYYVDRCYLICLLVLFYGTCIKEYAWYTGDTAKSVKNIFHSPSNHP